MSRIIWPVALVIIAAILASGGVLAAQSLRPAVRVVTVQATAPTASATSATVTKARSKPVTRTIVGIPCAELSDGGLLVFPHGALGDAVVTTCSFTTIGADYLNEFQATAPDGRTVDFTVGGP